MAFLPHDTASMMLLFLAGGDFHGIHASLSLWRWWPLLCLTLCQLIHPSQPSLSLTFYHALLARPDLLYHNLCETWSSIIPYLRDDDTTIRYYVLLRGRRVRALLPSAGRNVACLWCRHSFCCHAMSVPQDDTVEDRFLMSRDVLIRCLDTSEDRMIR